MAAHRPPTSIFSLKVTRIRRKVLIVTQILRIRTVLENNQARYAKLGF